MKRTPGFLFLTIIGLLLIVVYLLGQTMAVIFAQGAPGFNFTVFGDSAIFIKTAHR